VSIANAVKLSEIVPVWVAVTVVGMLVSYTYGLAGILGTLEMKDAKPNSESGLRE